MQEKVISTKQGCVFERSENAGKKGTILAGYTFDRVDHRSRIDIYHVFCIPATYFQPRPNGQPNLFYRRQVYDGQ